jgi:hypothetical protein
MTVSLLTLVKFTTKPLVTVTLALFHLAVLLVMTQLRSVLFAVGSNKEDKTSIVIVIADSDFVISLAHENTAYLLLYQPTKLGQVMLQSLPVLQLLFTNVNMIHLLLHRPRNLRQAQSLSMLVVLL